MAKFYPPHVVLGAPRKRQKYSAVPTTVNGIRFASKREAHRYQELLLLERAGHITNLRLQVVYPLRTVGGVQVAKYIADFTYVDLRTIQTVVEDVKGVKTPLFRLKARWLKAQDGIEVQCV